MTEEPRLETAEDWETSNSLYALLSWGFQSEGQRKHQLLGSAVMRRVAMRTSLSMFDFILDYGDEFVDGRSVRADYLKHLRTIRRIRYGTRFKNIMDLAIAAEKLLESPEATLEYVAEIATPEEMMECCEMIRDVFPNPFHSFSFDRRQFISWLKWNDSTVSKMAHAIYDSKQCLDLPVLADALEEAGCVDPLILEHCRADTTHIRGCWVVDLMTGRDNTSVMQTSDVDWW